MALDTATRTPEPDEPSALIGRRVNAPVRIFWQRLGWLFPRRRGESAEPPPSAPAATPEPSTLLRLRARRERRFSPLTRRILLLNMLPVAFLAGAVVFLGDYERELIETELDALRLQGEIVAAGIGETSIKGGETTVNTLERDLANQLLVRLVQPTGVRARLFGETGAMLGDTRALTAVPGTITAQPLAPPDQSPSHLQRLNEWLDRMMSRSGEHPRYVEKADAVARDYGEVERALRGTNASAIRRMDDGRLMLSVAVPVQRYKQVLAALMLSHDSRAIAGSLRDLRWNLVKIGLAALTATVLLSLYLASTIARPITRLARAADQIRWARDQRPRIPDLGARRDEISDLNESLSAMTETLWRRMNTIESFAADVAHELKNPLTSLRSAVETALRIEDPEKRAKLMRIVLDDVTRLNRLISDISDASRLDAELMRAEYSPVDVAALLGTLVEGYNVTTAERAKVMVEMATLGRGPFIAIGHDGRYGQVLRNVIDNAISFSPPGSKVVVGLMRERDQVVVTIDDQGPGIPEANLESIFRRFYSERPTGEDFGTHSGLGLSICRQICEAYGGSITASNLRRPDGSVCGARFTIRLATAH
jgi:two-component system sensor histidine kinase ChvG